MFSEFLLLICQLTPEKASTQTKLKMATHRDKIKVKRPIRALWTDVSRILKILKYKDNLCSISFYRPSNPYQYV